MSAYKFATVQGGFPAIAAIATLLPAAQVAKILEAIERKAIHAVRLDSSLHETFGEFAINGAELDTLLGYAPPPRSRAPQRHTPVRELIEEGEISVLAARKMLNVTFRTLRYLDDDLRPRFASGARIYRRSVVEEYAARMADKP